MSGSVVVDGKVSYASQEPWIFSGSLRENILFGLPYKHEWYQKVVEACSLNKVWIFSYHTNCCYPSKQVLTPLLSAHGDIFKDSVNSLLELLPSAIISSLSHYL